MKSLFTLIVLLVAGTANAQFTVGMSAGTSNSKALVQLDAGYSFGNIYVGYDMRSHIIAEKAAHLGAKAIYFFRINDFHAGPAVGFYRRLVSSDDKWLNGHDAGYGLKAGYKWLSIESYRVGKFTQVTLGVFAFIITKDKCR